MVAHVVEERKWIRTPRGLVRKTFWHFFTLPLLYNVYWQPDGTKTVDQFIDEQKALVLQHMKEVA